MSSSALVLEGTEVLVQTINLQMTESHYIHHFQDLWEKVEVSGYD